VRVRGGWWIEAALAAAFVAITAALAAGLTDPDLAVRDWCDAHRPAALDNLARAANYLGQGGVLTVVAGVLALVVGWRTRTVRPLSPVVTAFVFTTATVLPLKWWTDRAAPSSTLPDAGELFNNLPPGEYAESYPAGHLVVAIVWYGVIVVLLEALVHLPRWLHVTIRVAPPAILLVSTTYLSFHWLTDGLAGICLGLLLDRLVWRIPWNRALLS